MNKKILILILSIITLAILAFFAYDKHFKYCLGKNYRQEVIEFIEKEIPIYIKKIDNVENEIKNEKDPWVRAVMIDNSVDGVLFDFYMDLINITEKYSGKDSVRNAIPPTDFSELLREALIPYLDKNKTNASEKINSLVKYAISKEKEYSDKYFIEF